MSRHIQVAFDARDPQALSSFWRDALGYVHPGPPAPPMSAGFIVLTDPEGNEFCLD
jgi:hypothetical protein